MRSFFLDQFHPNIVSAPNLVALNKTLNHLDKHGYLSPSAP